MISLYNTTTDISQPIATLDELRAAMPAEPANPSLYAIDGALGFIVTVIYGSPDERHAEVKVTTADGVDRDTLDSFDAATDRFLAIARHAF